MIATEAEVKAWRDVQARLLLAGYCADLLEGDDGRPDLVVWRWSFTWAFDDIAAAEAWATQVSGKGAISQPASAGVRLFRGDVHESNSSAA